MPNQGFDHLDTQALVSTTVIGKLRWIALVGQMLAILIVYFGLGFPLPIYACLMMVASSALVGLGQAIYTRGKTKLSRKKVLALLVFDTVQLGGLIVLTGGLANPFVIMLIAPVTVSASVLPPRDTTFLVVLVVVLASILSVVHNPLPWGDAQFVMPVLYMIGLWLALVLTTIFVAGYAGMMSRHSRRLARGLAEVRLTMARENQMVALGSLATAAAHKLGSPLNTITLIAHDLNHPPHGDGATPMGEDIRVLIDETERCRKILEELNEDAIRLGQENDDPVPAQALVSSLIDERFEDIQALIDVVGRSDDGSPEPMVIRRPELLYPLETVIENAAQFTATRVSVELCWRKTELLITITDDGKGIPPSVLARLGDPYNSSRQGIDGHMGLGVFIAMTMVEQIGGSITLSNGIDVSNNIGGGAQVIMRYPRDKIEMSGHLTALA
jgi:two-component system sensor histidine kinase RegB